MIFDRRDTMTAFYFVISWSTNYPLNHCPCQAFLLTSFKCQGLSRLKKEKESVNNSTKELPAKLNFCWWLSMSQKSGYWWWSRYSQPCSSQDLLWHIFFLIGPSIMPSYTLWTHESNWLWAFSTEPAHDEYQEMLHGSL